jgi:hypothetical protein
MFSPVALASFLLVIGLFVSLIGHQHRSWVSSHLVRAYTTFLSLMYLPLTVKALELYQCEVVCSYNGIHPS